MSIGFEFEGMKIDFFNTDLENTLLDAEQEQVWFCTLRYVHLKRYFDVSVRT